MTFTREEKDAMIRNVPMFLGKDPNSTWGVVEDKELPLGEVMALAPEERMKFG